jgi:TolA-binding protein
MMSSHLRSQWLFLTLFIFLSTTLLNPAAADPTEEDKAKEQIEFASGLFERGLYDMAASEYQEFIKTYGKSPLLPDAYFGYAESLFFGKKYSDCAAAFETVATLQGAEAKTPVSYLRAGQCYEESGNMEKAEKSISAVEAAKLSPNFRQVYDYAMSKIARAQNKIPDAIGYLEKGMDLQGDPKQSITIQFDLADLYNQTGAVDKAAQLYQRLYASAADAGAKSVAAYKEGELYFRQKDFAKAKNAFLIVYTEFPEQAIAKDAFKGTVLSLFNLKDYQAVISEYEKNKKVIAFTEDNFDVFFAVGMSYALSGHSDESAAVWDDVLAKMTLKEESRRLVLLKKAETLIRAGKTVDATGFLEKNAADLKGAQDKIVYLRAEGLYAEKKYPEAADAYRSFLKSFPQSALTKEATYGLAHALKESGKNEEAAAAFKKYAEMADDPAMKEGSLYNAILLDAKLEHVPQLLSSA